MDFILISNNHKRLESLEKKFSNVKSNNGNLIEPFIHKNVFLYNKSTSIRIEKHNSSNNIYSEEHLTIVFDGRIYNYSEINENLKKIGCKLVTKRSEELLLKAYLKWGREMLKMINGVFSIIIYDRKREEVFCARDRFGVKSIFYFIENGTFEISNRLSPLINKSSKVSNEAISLYFKYGYVPTPLSIIENISKLKPGHYLIADILNEGINIKEEYAYWDLEEISPLKISYLDAKNELHRLIKNAIDIRLETDMHPSSFLSGGIDSSLIASILAKRVGTEISSFTVAFDDSRFNEGNIAKQFAEIIGTNHYEFLYNPSFFMEMANDFVKIYDEPFADSSALPTLFLHRQSKKYSSIVFTGEGGDESFLAKGQFGSMRKFDILSKIPLFIRNYISKFPVGNRLKRILETSSIENFMNISLYGTDKSLLRYSDNIVDIDKYYGDFKNLSADSTQRFADFSIKLLWENDFNVKVGRSSANYSLDLRSPLMDNEVVEFARSLPVNYRLDRVNGKKILRDILEEYIPREIFDQPKKGFGIPLGTYLRGCFKDEVLNVLELEYHREFDFFDEGKFSLMLNDHMKGTQDNSIYIWRVYVLNKWFQEYLY